MEIPCGTLSKRHISNLLHVLMGERPSPSLRSSLIESIAAIKTLADKAFVSVESIVRQSKNRPEEYLTECKSVRKSVPNSWNTAGHEIVLKGRKQKLSGVNLTWEVLKAFLGEGLFSKFHSLCISLLGYSCLSERAENVLEKLSDINDNPEVQNFIEECKTNQKTPMAHILSGTTISAAFNQTSNVLVRRTVPKGIETIARIDGTIFIPMQESDLSRIQFSSATFLEGGMAWISSVEDFSDNLILGCVKPVE